MCVVAYGRVVLGFLALFPAAAEAAAPLAPPRLAVDLRGLQTGSEVVYHPNRWLTIRRSTGPVAVRTIDDRTASAPSPPASARTHVMAADVHPFGDAFRLSFGVREDENRRLLRSSNDTADIGTARYAPLLSMGLAGEIAEGLSIGGDVGLLGSATVGSAGAVVVTPVERLQTRAEDGRGYRTVVSLSAGYRF